MAFHFVRQHDSMQCGVACLAMIARHHGRRIGMGEIEEICHPSAAGVSMKGICDAAGAIGLETYPVRTDTQGLDPETLPCILHWDQNHFVVLYGISGKGRYRIADPGKGCRTYGREEFERHWCAGDTPDEVGRRGIALFLRPTPAFRDRRVVHPRKEAGFNFLLRYIRGYSDHVARIVLSLLVGCILQLIMPFLTQAVVDIGIRHRDIGFIWLVLLGELMIVIGRTATDFIRRWLLLHVSMRVNISLVSDFFIKLLRLPMSFFDTRHMGDLLQRISDHSRVQTFLTGQVLDMVFTALSFIIFGAVLLGYDAAVFGIFVAGSLCYALWIASFLGRRKTLDYDLFGQQSVSQNRTYQFITSMQEIKLQDCGRRRRWEWEDAQADLFTLQMRSLRLKQAQEAGSVFINEVKNMLITVLSASAVIAGSMSLGEMLAVQYIIGQLNSPVEQLMGFIYSLQDVRISLERIGAVHRTGDEGGGSATMFENGKSISLNGIDFRYDPHSLKKTIDGVSFDIPEGKVTAIVGASGSGKTTLMKLMLGYYPVQEGAILISGRNISEYDMGWWRRQCGVVMQDGVIFSESIARNIAVGDGDIDYVRLEEAASIANIHGFVTGLPLGYDTIIGRDGMGLSQGQKQRILIARAVYKNPAFIFLDEATNALDASNERTIVENLDGFYRGRTVVVVAHRLSTVRNADRIIVLDRGRVVETGDHESLIGRKGAYYNLVKNQLELGE